ncbi:MAG: ABC transporter permease [Chloroflexi bacterium]|nr:ABC transporter permease [Chloroflexota bacterium]
MTAYIIRRVFWYPFLLLAVAAVTLALGLYGPGDPAQVYLGKYNDPERAARIREQWGIDKPFHEQLIKFVGDALQGDFHESLVKYPGQKVSDLIANRLGVTMQMNAVGLAIGLLLGVPLGILASVRHNRWIDHVISFGVVLGVAIPVFAAAPFLLWIFARDLPLWTAANLGVKIGLPPGGWDGIFTPSAVLPMVVLSPGYIAVFTRQTRIALVEALGQDYIRTARAKGLREQIVIGKHALRNALIPLSTLFGLALGGLVSGSYLVEVSFGIPNGLGNLLLSALGSRDYPIILALTLMVAFVYITLNLIVDIAYTWIDPRIRYK